jgi:ABC-type microcin C transport system duplicated ATPase subunit YejF
LLVRADDVNILGDNINMAKKNTETSTDPSKEVGLEVARPLPTHRTTQKNKRTQKREDNSRFRPYGHCDGR